MKIRIATIIFSVLMLFSCTKHIDDTVLNISKEDLLLPGEESNLELSAQNSILAINGISLNGNETEDYTAQIMQSERFISVTLPQGSNISSVSFTFELSEYAEMKFSSSGLNFTGTGLKLFTVVAENGDEKTYAIKVKVIGDEVEPTPSPNEITAVTQIVDNTTGSLVSLENTTIDIIDNDIKIELPFGTAVTDLSFMFTYTETSILIEEGLNLNFYNGQSNTVVLQSEDEEIRTYTLEVTVETDNPLSDENDIIGITITTGVEPVEILYENDAPVFDNNTIVIELPSYTDLSNLDLELTLSQLANLEEGTLTENLDFTNAEAKVFTVVAQDLVSTQQYAIDIVADSSINSEAFITTWLAESVTIPINPAYEYNYSVDWDNDGIIDDSNITGDITHTYDNVGPHTIQITGQFPAINFGTGAGDKTTLVGLEQWGTSEWLSMAFAFFECENLIINATDVPNLTMVTSMNSMFYYASKANPDVSNWNVSNVTTMHSMFRNATLANPDVSDWDVSNVTNMFAMFAGAASANPNVGSWDVSSVTSMGSMFERVTLANPNVSGWDVSSVTDMIGMFYEATSADPDISNWETPRVNSVSNMFSNSGITNPDFSNWDISNVTSMSNIFEGVTLETEVYDKVLADLAGKMRNQGVEFGGGNSTYCNEAAWQELTDTGWIIADEGLDENCEEDNPEILAQQQALLNMSNGTANWSPDVPLADWDGITLDPISGNIIGFLQNGAAGVRYIDEFNANLGDLVYLETISTISNEITSLPDEICNLTSLRSLNLINNSLTTLPDCIGDLVHLEAFELRGNNLTSLPESFGNLTSLPSTLDLRNNQLATLPESIGNLTQVTSLNLLNNSLNTLPDSIGDLSQLTSLTLSSNELTALPNSIGDLTLLESLFLIDNNLEVLPENLGNLTALITLDLGRNSLVSLPESFENLTMLETLNLHTNNLEVLPENIGNLRNLTSFEIAQNSLEIIPESIGDLTMIPSLDLQNNQLINLPERIGDLTQITSLNLLGNQLSILPNSIGNLTSLQTLSLSNNELEILPENIGDLTALETLNLDRNPIENLPESFGNLTSLVTLVSHSSNLTSLPASITNLTALETLDLRKNLLESLPENIGNLESLTRLLLANTIIAGSTSTNRNVLTTLPESVGDLLSLTELTINNNNLTSIPSSIGNLEGLETLNLINNASLISIPQVVCDLELTGTTITKDDTAVCE